MTGAELIALAGVSALLLKVGNMMMKPKKLEPVGFPVTTRFDGDGVGRPVQGYVLKTVAGKYGA